VLNYYPSEWLAPDLLALASSCWLAKSGHSLDTSGQVRVVLEEVLWCWSTQLSRTQHRDSGNDRRRHGRAVARTL